MAAISPTAVQANPTVRAEQNQAQEKPIVSLAKKVAIAVGIALLVAGMIATCIFCPVIPGVFVAVFLGVAALSLAAYLLSRARSVTVLPLRRSYNPILIESPPRAQVLLTDRYHVRFAEPVAYSIRTRLPYFPRVPVFPLFTEVPSERRPQISVVTQAPISSIRAVPPSRQNTRIHRQGPMLQQHSSLGSASSRPLQPAPFFPFTGRHFTLGSGIGRR